MFLNFNNINKLNILYNRTRSKIKLNWTHMFKNELYYHTAYTARFWRLLNYLWTSLNKMIIFNVLHYISHKFNYHMILSYLFPPYFWSRTILCNNFNFLIFMNKWSFFYHLIIFLDDLIEYNYCKHETIDPSTVKRVITQIIGNLGVFTCRVCRSQQ